MAADQELSFAHHFADLTDPRIDRSRLHELLDIVAIAICAVVAGAESWDDIEDFGHAKHGWLETFLALPNGIPSHDTFRRVFERLDPDEFRRCFLGWIEALHEETDRRVIAIDGKTLRRSFDRAKGRSALHLVHAWATANHLLLGQVAVGERSNEITAIPKLLRMLELSGAIVTIDAMGCQREIAQTIRDRGADYLLALKANHERLFEQVQGSWAGSCAHGRKGGGIRYHREWSEGHGRTETRRCWATSDLSWLEGRQEWADLRSVVLVESERYIGESLAVEERYDLSSLPADAKLLNEAARSHWAVENSLHWALDVTFHEDSSRIRKGAAPENFGLLRRLALCLLKKETSSKRSLRGKRLRASWDDSYLLQVMCGSTGNKVRRPCEPERFRPERFLERKYGSHEWFPFGGGNRVCLGMPFALYEMKALLATLFSQARLARPAGARSRARRYGLVLGPDDGTRVIVRELTIGGAVHAR